MTSLPIDDVLPAVVEAVRTRWRAVLQAPPGAGKTTGVPPALLPLLENRQRLLLLQPRRLAARAAASRLAHLLHTQLGHDVGYQVRFDRRWGAETRLISMTTGVLMRRLVDDPFLEDVGCVVLDEFHERSIEVDLALGMLVRLQQTVRPDLQLVVMSATIAAEHVAGFLDAGPPILSSGRSFPVDIRYARNISRQPLEEQIERLLPEVLKATGGHVLIFLPGVGEIRRVERQLPRSISTSCDVYPLYGDLSPESQDQVLQPSDRRKIILATNVAETSVTIDGVTAVIDSGLARVSGFEPSVGLPRLELQPISQASADQRAGRAGRTAPGVCWRLWTSAAHRSRPAFDTPEVHRSDLSEPLLLMTRWGERQPEAFPWLDPPREAPLQQAQQTLRLLGAIDRDGAITSRGERMVRLPAHPRIARMLLEAADVGGIRHAAIAAAMLSERDPFRAGDSGRPPQRGAAPRTGELDIPSRVAVLEEFAAGGAQPVPLNRAAAQHVIRVADSLMRQMELLTQENRTEDVHALPKALLAGYPDRVALRRGTRESRALMVGGRGVKLASATQVGDSELFLCIDVDDRGANATVRQACRIEKEWLDPALLQLRTDHFFHPTLRSVVARRRTYYVDLVLDETPTAVDPAAAGEMLAREAIKNWDRVFPADDPQIGALIRRVRFLHRVHPDADVPKIDTEYLHELCRQIATGCTAFDQLRSAPWYDMLTAAIGYDALQRIEREVPTHWTAPSGNRIPIEYQAEGPPILAIRLQELFGLDETPRIVGKRVKLLLHLLGPNMRAQQVTDDLPSFWRTTYEQVKKELRRRYPKHHWPDDPLAATPTRSGLARDSRN